MRKNFGRNFCHTDDSSPLYSNNLRCIGNIADFLGKNYPCDDIYGYWVFRDLCDEETKYYAFWDLGNGWWDGNYFIADDLIQLWTELKNE